jgi:hypothetical protein
MIRSIALDAGGIAEAPGVVRVQRAAARASEQNRS